MDISRENLEALIEQYANLIRQLDIIEVSMDRLLNDPKFLRSHSALRRHLKRLNKQKNYLVKIHSEYIALLQEFQHLL